MQLACLSLGSRVTAAKDREFGRTELTISNGSPLFKGVPRRTSVWMSHGDKVETASREFEVLAATRNCANAAVRHRSRPLYGVQFHPEVVHTPRAAASCAISCSTSANAKGLEDDVRHQQAVADIRRRSAPRGASQASREASTPPVVDARPQGDRDRLTCVFVDNGLLRRGESDCAAFSATAC
jgi:GMP synthase (glutamine-hydrolysing)